MSSWVAGLDIAYRALQAQQQAIGVVNHNIANANTPGYSRQVASLATTMPSTIITINGAKAIGTGVMLSDISRSRNAFTDYQIRSESESQGQWEKLRDVLKQVEVTFNEPSDSGLNSLMSRFWQAWQDLTNNPQDAGARRSLVEQANSMTVGFNRVYSQLASIGRNTDAEISVEIDQINGMASELGSLNTQISGAERVGQKANDLRDQRDLILDKLSKMVHVTYYESSDGKVAVFLGSRSLVSAGAVSRLSVVPSGGISNVVWADDQGPATVTDGELYGLQRARDLEIPTFINELQSLASTIISKVNALHVTGFDLNGNQGQDFFDGTGADDIRVSDALNADPNNIAAAEAAGEPGDNTVGLKIAALQTDLSMLLDPVTGVGTADFGKFFASMMSRLGVDYQRADLMAGNQKVLVDHLAEQRDSTSGVSLDEETTHLIEYQRAYEAAARVINVVDEMLDKLINGVGIVGR